MELVTGIVGMAEFVVRRVPVAHRWLLNVADLKRLLRIECEFNARFLKCFKLEAGSGDHQDIALILASRKLETSCLREVLGIGTKAEKLVKELDEVKIGVAPGIYEGEEEEDPPRKGRSVTESLVNVFIATTTLQTVVSILSDDSLSKSDAIKNVRVRARLAYLQNAYSKLAAALARS